MRKVLTIKCRDKNPDTEILMKAGILCVSIFFFKIAIVVLTGHAFSAEDERLPKNKFYGQLKVVKVYRCGKKAAP